MIIKKVKVINHNKTIKNANVHIKNGKIIKIEKLKGESNKIIIPGFIDIHIHGLKGKDVMDGEKALLTISKELAKKGTTSFLPTLMTDEFSKILKVFEEIKNTKDNGSHIIGFHLEGPFISKAKKGAHNEKLLLKPTIKHIDDLIKATDGKLKKIVLAPEVTELNVLKHIIKNDIIASMGHSNAKGKLVDDFIKNGSTSATHLWNGMSGVANRDPGIVQKVLMSNKVVSELICDLAHVDKETLTFSINNKTPNNIIAITDAIRPAQTKFKESTSGGFKIIKDGIFIKIKETGSIAGGNSVMYDNFKNIMSLGYSINDAIKMTSYNPARELKLKTKGEIKINNDADVIILDEGLKLKEVYIGGKQWK